MKYSILACAKTGEENRVNFNQANLKYSILACAKTDEENRVNFNQANFLNRNRICSFPANMLGDVDL